MYLDTIACFEEAGTLSQHALLLPLALLLVTCRAVSCFMVLLPASMLDEQPLHKLRCAFLGSLTPVRMEIYIGVYILVCKQFVTSLCSASLGPQPRVGWLPAQPCSRSTTPH